MHSLGLLFLRVIIGAIMMAHGYPKLFGGKDRSEQLPAEAKEALGESFRASRSRSSRAASIRPRR